MRLLVGGDYIVDNRQYSVDIFGDLLPLLKNADYSIYNQEHPVTDSKEIYPVKKYGPTGALRQKAVLPVIEAGFSCAALANNHIFNRGDAGLKDTITFFSNNGLDTVGAGSTIKEAQKALIVEKDNVKFAILNYAEIEFNTATQKHGGANPLDIVDNVKQIRYYKKLLNNVIVIIHGGVEYCPYPTPRMVNQYRFYVENGASAVICHHSHIISGYEYYKGSPIFYGIGNLIPLKYLDSLFDSFNLLTSYVVSLEFSNAGLIGYNFIPFTFSKKEMKLKISIDEQLLDINEKQGILNKIISSDELLEKEILNSLTEDRKMYYKLLFTRSNYFLYKILRKLNLLKLYYPVINKRIKLSRESSAQWDLLRCSSHRDILNIFFNQEIDI